MKNVSNSFGFNKIKESRRILLNSLIDDICNDDLMITMMKCFGVYFGEGITSRRVYKDITKYIYIYMIRKLKK